MCSQGVAMPAMNNLLSKWVPMKERSRSLALVYSGMYLGSVLGLSLSPGLIHGLGWPSVFYSFGSLGVVWSLFWQQKVTELRSPEGTEQCCQKVLNSAVQCLILLAAEGN